MLVFVIFSIEPNTSLASKLAPKLASVKVDVGFFVTLSGQENLFLDHVEDQHA